MNNILIILFIYSEFDSKKNIKIFKSNIKRGQASGLRRIRTRKTKSQYMLRPSMPACEPHFFLKKKKKIGRMTCFVLNIFVFLKNKQSTL